MAPVLRRRAVGGGTPSNLISPISTPRDDSPVALQGQIKSVDKIRKTRKRRNTGIFLLGSIFGIIAAGLFAQSNDLIDFPELGELSMDSFLDVLPAGFVKDMHDLVRGERDLVDSYDSFAVGLKVRAEGMSSEHPVIMIPGVISTGLESWGTSNVSRPYFRKRLWGSWSMMKALVMDKETWKKHIMLDPETGMDPPHIKLRAAQGFDATDFFITGYWIWNKILENLASLGYDTSNAFTAAYDWRLSYPHLETRDQYFSRLKWYIEMSVHVQNKKVVLISHSMGSQVLFYFFHWVASDSGSGEGNDWVDRHVEAWINISGSMLGAVKDVAALLSGEMRDTAQLNAFAVYGLEKFLSKDERAEIFRHMPGMASMLPMGGNSVWGDLGWAPDDRPGQTQSFGSFMNFRTGQNWTIPGNGKNFTIHDSMQYLFNTTEEWFQDRLKRSYSQDVARTTAEVEANENDPTKWSNPLETRLPLAPNLRIYCFYGVGKPTERAYYYRSPDPFVPTNLSVTMDTALTVGEIDHGVIMGEGDGTVSLLSMGYMCNKGWKINRYNPAGVKVTVVEMPHEPERFNPRGGPNTADHVDILGRQKLNELVLQVAAGRGASISNVVVSNIREYAEKVLIYEEDGR